MILRRSDPFKKDFKKLPQEIQSRAVKQLEFLLQNPRHPSLHTKKMEDPRNIWEARITRGYRFTFQIGGDVLVLRRIGGHDILKNP